MTHSLHFGQRAGRRRLAASLLTLVLAIAAAGCATADRRTAPGGPTTSVTSMSAPEALVAPTNEVSEQSSVSGQPSTEASGSVQAPLPPVDPVSTFDRVPMDGYRYTVEQPAEHAGLVLDFADGLLRISNGCVSILGSAQLDPGGSATEGTMKVGRVREGGDMCAMAAWTPDDIYDHPVDFSIDGDQLTISYPGRRFELTRWTPVFADQPLERVNWQPAPVLEAGIVYGTDIVLQLGDGKFYLQESYCRHVQGKVQVSDAADGTSGTFSLSELQVNETDCPRSRFGPALDAVVQDREPVVFRIQLDRLTLTVNAVDLVLHTNAAGYRPTPMQLDGRLFRVADPQGGPPVDLRFVRHENVAYLILVQGCALAFGAIEFSKAALAISEPSSADSDCDEQVLLGGKPAVEFLSGEVVWRLTEGGTLGVRVGKTDLVLQELGQGNVEPSALPGVWRLSLIVDGDGVRVPGGLVELRTDWKQFDPVDGCVLRGGDDGGLVLDGTAVLASACFDDAGAGAEVLNTIGSTLAEAGQVLIGENKLLVAGPSTTVMLTRQPD